MYRVYDDEKMHLVPGPFLSEVSVDVFFTESGDVGIVEITFQVCNILMHNSEYYVHFFSHQICVSIRERPEVMCSVFQMVIPAGLRLLRG